MKEMTHKEVKQLQLDILSSVHDFCDSNGLRYSLAGGTLLGAVRHKGFIPWDDDIDILMPRPDYELFIQKYQKEHHVVQNYITDKGYFFLFTKIYDDRTTIIEDRTKTGVCIDVFPVDGLPNKENSEKDTFFFLFIILNYLYIHQENQRLKNLKNSITPINSNLLLMPVQYQECTASENFWKVMCSKNILIYLLKTEVLSA